MKQTVGFRAHKGKTFARENIAKFILAPDEIYLMLKVAIIFCLAWVCRELMKITPNDIEDKENIITKIKDSKIYLQDHLLYRRYKQ